MKSNPEGRRPCGRPSREMVESSERRYREDRSCWRRCTRPIKMEGDLLVRLNINFDINGPGREWVCNYMTDGIKINEVTTIPSNLCNSDSVSWNINLVQKLEEKKYKRKLLQRGNFDDIVGKVSNSWPTMGITAEHWVLLQLITVRWK